jgi:hypothetical protein
MGLKVFKECCKNCLLSEDRIVSSKRAKEIIKDCVENRANSSAGLDTTELNLKY